MADYGGLGSANEWLAGTSDGVDWAFRRGFYSEI